jgi:hypothetical protein
MYMLKNLKTRDKKCSIKYHNLHDKNKNLHNSNIFNAMVKKSHKFIQFMIYETKKKKKKSKEKILKQFYHSCFVHVKCKGNFPFSPFVLTSTPLLTIS